LTLFGTGISVGAASNSKLLQILQSKAVGDAASVALPTYPALIVAFISIASKEWLYRITRKVGEELNSQVVIANAWHHRSDAYSSILALASIFLAMSVPGMVVADAGAGLLVAGMICMTGAEIMGEAVKQLTDTSDEKLEERVKMLALHESEDVVEVERIRTRWMGSSAIVDLALRTAENLTSSANKAIETRVKYAIMSKEKHVIDAEVRATSHSVVEPNPELNGEALEQKESASVQEIESDATSLLLSHDEVRK
jgi:cation diffusion facilitator family transporter